MILGIKEQKEYFNILCIIGDLLTLTLHKISIKNRIYAYIAVY